MFEQIKKNTLQSLWANTDVERGVSKLPARRRLPCVLAMSVLLLGLTQAIYPQPRYAFHFNQYMDLKTGDTFHIIATTGDKKGQTIGSGSVYLLNATQLHLHFKANPGGMSVQGEVQVKYIQRQGSKIQLQLHYRGLQAGLSRQNSEAVLVDAFLADNGILSMHYANRKYFLQLSRNRAGHNKFITDWGSARLLKK